MKNLIPFVSILILLVSCNDKIDELSGEGPAASNQKAVVLKERNPNYEWHPYDTKSNFTKANTFTPLSNDLYHGQYLGYSIKNNVYPLEDTRNLGYSVIDIPKLEKDYNSYITTWKNNTGEAKCFSYSSFDRYVSNSSVTNNVSGGASINLGLFSIGSKNAMKEVFTNSLVEDKNTVFGELKVILRDSCYRLQMSSNIKNLIRTNYLSDTFKEELYSTHPSEFFSNYGGFVLSDYVVGGKATAVYAGRYQNEEASEYKEKNMNTEMDSSFTFSAGGASGNLTLGRGNSSGVSTTNKFTSIKMSIKTVGGNSSFASFSIPKEINNTDVNLKDWITSINDKKTHNIVEIGNEGLIPITDFIVESNLKRQIEGYYANGVTSIEHLQEPFISLEVMAYRPPQLYVISTVLNTRSGNRITLKNKFWGNMYDPEFDNMIKQYKIDEAERITKIFGVRVEDNVLGGRNIAETPQPETYYDYDAFNETYLKKFVYNGTIYVISDYYVTSPSHPSYKARYALSIHLDRIQDDYAMREFVNRIPTTNVDYETLIRDYVIYAL